MKKFLILSACLFITLITKTYLDIKPIVKSFSSIILASKNFQFTDRNGIPLNISYQNNWNEYEHLKLYQIPKLLKEAFIISEDVDFYKHRGINWRSRFVAIWQNLKSFSYQRGASTITEQVVKMLHPRPRTIWSKYLETIEAYILENNFSKDTIIEFYLNQIPFAANRRGILQAANYYFNRDLDTLSKKEIIALVILTRAPSSFDLYKYPKKSDTLINYFAKRLLNNNLISDYDFKQIKNQKFNLESRKLLANASHFINFINNSLISEYQQKPGKIRTTLDVELQIQLQAILDQRVKDLKNKLVKNAAALIIDHQTNEILAWVVAGANDPNTPSNKINAVLVPRQPGSALKPFLYAKALEKGWTAASLIDDSPISDAIGQGLHNFKNYSRTYYGNISLREALGNSLNIPAIRTIRYVGISEYLKTLRELGFKNLNKASNIYDEGLALGNGEVSLLELTSAYSALANNGAFSEIKYIFDSEQKLKEKIIFSKEVASLINNILSDPWARRLEFGQNSILNFPQPTAVKTGTSTDYRDAWSLGFNSNYAVGIWMGNLDQKPTKEVTGSVGPALALRSIFSALNYKKTAKPLFLSSKLIKKDICININNKSKCIPRTEYFINSTSQNTSQNKIIELVKPSDGLQIAIDPRVPLNLQKFEFKITGLENDETVTWLLNEQTLPSSDASYLWNIQPGSFIIKATIKDKNNKIYQIPAVNFTVK